MTGVNRRRRSVERHQSVSATQLTCARCEEALSATADREPTDVSPLQIERHLVGCVSCRRFRDSIAAVSAGPTLTAVTEITPQRVARLAARADRARAPSIVRYVLAAVGAAITLIAVPDLWASDASAVAAHAERHLGSFSLAYGALMLVVALRPARARTALPVAVVLGAAIGITAVGDLVRGKIPLLGEAIHLPELASVLLVWLLAKRSTQR
jgi:predicted anti-sigma-YlaC factor YlaD